MWALYGLTLARWLPGEGILRWRSMRADLGASTGNRQLPTRIEAAGLCVLDKADTRPPHLRATDAADPLHAARSVEVTSLWRLACE